jgi:hypothetical protein
MFYVQPGRFATQFEIVLAEFWNLKMVPQCNCGTIFEA